MRCAIGEMNMKVIYTVTREKVCKIEGIARALLGLDARAIFSLVSIDELTRPFAGCFRVLFTDPQDCLRRRIVNWRT